MSCYSIIIVHIAIAIKVICFRKESVFSFFLLDYNFFNMEWKLKDIIQETNHPYLNFFTLVYEVSKDGKKSEYRYFLASRHSKETLLAKCHDFSKPDGVLIPLYYINPEDKQIYFLLTRQFRPAVGSYVTSLPAGLADKDDKDSFEVAKREALEEAGAIISDLELISSPSPTSSGLSDEIDSIVLARIERFETSSLEEFEDIKTNLYPLEEVKKMLNDREHCLFPLTIRLILLYLIERFQKDGKRE